MRVIAGAWRGRMLVAPRGDATRPTADRVRETLFSMLVSRIGAFEGLRIADLFAGSGALGIEALSRGAAHVTFVEQDDRALAALRANLSTLDAGTRARIVARSVLSLGPRDVRTDGDAGGAFDVVLLDPPYGTGAGVVALERLARMDWLGPATLAVVESGRTEAARPSGFGVLAERDVGPARLTFLEPARQP